ncbi:MAG: substrate-binding domain-containing protein [Candidatus Cohnella colombiensis]|uniref:Substrate-binding domain-containing protein n=1 Tax=Candidatus Cohnella colombiensis TaxID=3121368 RepID=A0AA95EVI9_9BACL|nr:MAG: substrate-binding domain-containing protein [Cohnella sp.]
MISQRRRYKDYMLYKFILIFSLFSSTLACSSPTSNTQLPVQSHTETDPLSPELTFGIIYPMAHSFYEVVTENAEEVAKVSGIELIVKAPDEANLEQQIRIMETLIRQNVDGIAIDPIDSVALTPYINKAINAGIPVICFESDSPASHRLSFIGADNLQSGTRMGEAINQLLKGRGMVLVETGMERVESLSERLEGFLNYINNKTDIDVLEVRYNEGNKERALLQLEQMIDDHPHFDAFVALDFISGSGSVLVWKAKGLNRYALTLGMMPELKEAIRNGQITIALSQNEGLWGELIVKYLLQAHNGKEIPEFVDTGISLVDLEALK